MSCYDFQYIFRKEKNSQLYNPFALKSTQLTGSKLGAAPLHPAGGTQLLHLGQVPVLPAVATQLGSLSSAPKTNETY